MVVGKQRYILNNKDQVFHFYKCEPGLFLFYHNHDDYLMIYLTMTPISEKGVYIELLLIGVV